MILSDQTIREKIDSGELTIAPFNKDAVQPASIDCHLGDEFLAIETDQIKQIDFNTKIKYKKIKNSKMIIHPQSFLLATTKESLKLPKNLTAFVEGRSSIGRMGLFIQNAGWVDPGFEGQITLELYNANSLPIQLESGRKICQLVFCQMNKMAARPYAGKYQGQKGVTGSKIYDDIL